MKKPAELQTVEGYVIDCNKYKECDAMITFLAADGYKRNYRVPGGYRPAGKNHLATMVLSRLRLDVGGYQDHPVVASCQLLRDYSPLYENLKQATAINVCREALIRVATEEDRLDQRYFEALLALEKPSTEVLLFAVLVFLVNIFCDCGILSKELSCAICGQSHLIYTYDFSLGGLLDRDCAERSDARLVDREDLKILVAAYKAQPENLASARVGRQLSLAVLHDLLDYLDESLGLKLKSFDNFTKWFLNL